MKGSMDVEFQTRSARTQAFAVLEIRVGCNPMRYLLMSTTTTPGAQASAFRYEPPIDRKAAAFPSGTHESGGPVNGL
jgi:hypothetical protein